MGGVCEAGRVGFGGCSDNLRGIWPFSLSPILSFLHMGL